MSITLRGANPGYMALDLWDVHRLKNIAKDHDALLFPGRDETGIQHLDSDEKLVAIESSPAHIDA